MEKTEIREKLDEMKKLTAAGKFEAAAKVADEIPWRKSHNINVMVRIAKVYEEVNRLDESEEILEFAYDRSPVARMVVYELAMLNIRRGNMNKAEMYYSDFVELAPHDSLRYVIKYKLSKARGADNATLISILEELKDEDFSEEWAYELANLYHKSGETEKCIDLCDEIILWFGDGPYVERALEIKMCYQPLDEKQEDKYRQIRAKQDGVTEIRPGEEASGEKLDSTIRIPEIQPPMEKYDTINLQAEIRKSIEEIMEAKEPEKVTESMENIKTLVEDIPYLQPDRHVTGPLPEEVEAEKDISRDIEERFKTLLAEEYDGQVSLVIPEQTKDEEQIEGQMTIEEMMAVWEKMRRAAAATLHEADEKKLEIEKAIALREANNIKEKLDAVAPALQAGVPSAELIKEDILHGRESVKDKASKGIFEIGTGFTIPKVTPEGDKPGIIIPVLKQEDSSKSSLHNTKPLPDIVEATDWKPEHFDEPKEELKEEPKEEPKIEPETAISEPEPEVSDPTPAADADLPAEKPVAEPSVDAETEQRIASIMENLNNRLQDDIDSLIEEEEAQASGLPNKTIPLPFIDISEFMDEKPEAEEEPKQDTAPLPEIPAQPAAAAPSIPAPVAAAASVLAASATPAMPVAQAASAASSEPVVPAASKEPDTKPLPVVEEYHVEPEIAAELINEEKLTSVAMEPELAGKTIVSLTDAQKQRLSYFAAVRNLEPQICTALTGAMTQLEHRDTMKSGNLLVVGDAGSGKTMLCTAFVKIMQDEIGKPSGKIGKLTGKALNDKDLTKVFSQVAGGTLIVEEAGDIFKETADKMAALLREKDCEIYVILEGEIDDIRKVVSLSPEFSALFTEKIIIPGLTDKELVSFAETYAKEKGFSLGDEGLLALYDRIRLAKQPTKNTTISTVKEIMDSAMDKATKKGVKGFFAGMSSKRYDDDDNIILREKDFS